jgi:hypothetical protein
MLIDSRLKPELCCKKADKPAESGDPVEHDASEHVFILRFLTGVTPKEVGEGEAAGVAFATDGRMAVAVPVTLGCDTSSNEGELPDVCGPVIPDALAHARKNLVAPKTASLQLLDETVTPDFAAFPRRLPGVDHEKTSKLVPEVLMASLGATESTDTISLDPHRLLAIAKAMGVKAGSGVTLLFRGNLGPISVLPMRTDACYAGEAVGLLMPQRSDETPDPDEGGDQNEAGAARAGVARE